MNHPVTLDEIRSFVQAHTLIELCDRLDTLYDLLVDDPAAFVELVCRSEYYIQNVIWWEHALIETGSTLGLGGPRDPHDSLRFYSETYLDDKFSPDTTFEEFLRYMTAIREAHPNLALHPGFWLLPREEKT